MVWFRQNLPEFVRPVFRSSQNRDVNNNLINQT